ncbi:putative actin-dependent regulator of chromatin subfamily A member [Wickerhamomyces ciferrii]|uniref:Actin-dependent regulator of chromatin subfamily A member n=1 Tax=Wickerhamomyces ciferrii (strain ATCC 14091 / BCRC 22168 / CBS 111 / JCM 3599 / NBRC 0793 / NRRL Y-1031 F-60-10) TaxID=1206466 RepID=K0KCI0_WICCF|nr:putative actin-dependent regulator of chromatin subfamily A member [Wickerhamomyces ciferrii]CCH40606.1 putative actin-dependent regulator of chromatin subfamily A member [Wickerhamomyces ciferrii]
MSSVDDLDDQLSSMSISPSKLPTTKKLDPNQKKPTNAAPKSSSIFLKKNFGSLSSPKKKPLNKNTSLTPTKKPAAFNKNAFFSDTPLAVDDKRWNNNKQFFSEFSKQKLSPNKDSLNPVVIDSPMKQNENVDPRNDIQFHQSGFKKYANEDSPFKDPYSALNNKSVSRTGAAFLDSPDQYADEQKLVDNLLAKIGEDDDRKELKKLQEPIEEKDRKVKGLSVNLLDHQVHGLKFLRKRERDKVIHKGGLLCDDMGLGKTVQTIALIVKNRPDADYMKDLDDLENDDLNIMNKNVPLRKFKATLVICPVSLTTQWSQEIKKFAPHLRVLIFHGPNRATNYKELKDYDVIISSYDTIRSDFEKEKSPIYQGYWYRVVLDEAHTIKNKKTKTSIAAYNIESLRRWCLTGTPIQNSMSELQSLFIFLRISKFANENYWNLVISKTLKQGKAKEAFSLLKEELKEIMLRRTKAILQSTNFNLPPKNIHRCEIQFTELEEQLYTDLKRHFVHSLEDQFEEIAFQNKDPSLKKSYEPGTLFSKLSPSKIGIDNKSSKSDRSRNEKSFSLCAIVYLLRLRQVCCHWKLLSDLSEEDLEELNKSSTVTRQSQQGNVSPSKRDMDVAQELDDITNFMNTLTVKETKCEICFVEKVKGTDKVCTKCHEKLEKNKKYEGSKVLKLLEILKKEPKRKTIVFSQFREMLLLMGPILKDHGISSVNYDGHMSLKQKDAALEKLRNNEDTTVLLCSLKSGALGLNLTVASQVVIFDPWWNPQIQAQAIDRVYRIGQTRSVDVYEFAIKDSVEEEILKLQDRKRNLAKAITDGDNTAKNKLFEKLSSNDLIKLFGLGKQ